jgi:hypothetical protein
MHLAIRTTLSILAASFALLAIPSAQAASPVKPCDLMTQQTAAGIFGGPVAPGRVEMSTPGAQDCRFDSHNGGMSEIGLMDSQFAGLKAADMYKVIATTADPGHAIEPIAALGEQAVFNKGPEDMTLSVLYHGKILIVSATGSKNPGAKAAMIAAARQALPKL